jgi:hypothetical protein
MLTKAAISTPIVFYAIRKKPAVGSVLGVASFAITLLTAIPYNSNWALFKHTRTYPGAGNWTPKER